MVYLWSRDNQGPQLVKCGPATVAPAAPAPRPSLLSQFIVCSSGHWPCSCSHTGPSPYLPGGGGGFKRNWSTKPYFPTPSNPIQCNPVPKKRFQSCSNCVVQTLSFYSICNGLLNVCAKASIPDHAPTARFNIPTAPTSIANHDLNVRQPCRRPIGLWATPYEQGATNAPF